MFGYSLARVLNTLFDIYYWLLIARIIFPLLRLGRDSHPLLIRIRQIVFVLTEPLLAPIRQILMPIQLGPGAYLDLSPIILMFLLRFVRYILFSLLF